ncbi:MAG: hypothetical protein RID91_03625 [Azospirillaceae bacterium]
MTLPLVETATNVAAVIRDPAWLPGNAGAMLRWYQDLDGATPGQPRSSAVLAQAATIRCGEASPTFHCISPDEELDALSFVRASRDDNVLAGFDALPAGQEQIRPVADLAIRKSEPVVMLLAGSLRPDTIMTIGLILPVRIGLLRAGAVLVSEPAPELSGG